MLPIAAKNIWSGAKSTMNLNLVGTVLPAKSDSDVVFCLQSFKGLIIDRLLVY